MFYYVGYGTWSDGEPYLISEYRRFSKETPRAQMMDYRIEGGLRVQISDKLFRFLVNNEHFKEKILGTRIWWKNDI